jgi:hypothetical protein
LNFLLVLGRAAAEKGLGITSILTASSLREKFFARNIVSHRTHAAIDLIYSISDTGTLPCVMLLANLISNNTQ